MKLDCLRFLVCGESKERQITAILSIVSTFQGRVVMTISGAQPFAYFHVAYFVPARRRCVSNVTQRLIGVPPLGFLYGTMTPEDDTHPDSDHPGYQHIEVCLA